MKNKHLKSLTVMAAVGSLLLVSACGSSSTTKDSAAPNNSGTKSDTQEIVTIKYWTWVPTDIQMGKVLDAFSKKYPNIKVEPYVAEGGTLWNKLQVALQAGEGPDVMGMQVGGKLNQFASLLEPLKPLADKNWGTGWENNFAPGTTEQTTAIGSNDIVACRSTSLHKNLSSIINPCSMKPALPKCRIRTTN